MNVKDIMMHSVITVSKDEPLASAILTMYEKRHGMLVIVEKDFPSHVVGILTEGDLISKVLIPGRTAAGLTVEDVMTKHAVCIAPEKTLSEAANLMRTQQIKRLPVTQDGKLIGIISSTDIVQSMMKTKKELLDMALEF